VEDPRTWSQVRGIQEKRFVRWKKSGITVYRQGKGGGELPFRQGNKSADTGEGKQGEGGRENTTNKNHPYISAAGKNFIVD